MAVSPWVVQPRPNPTAPVRLFCFPHAGGGVASFRGWADLLPNMDLTVLHLPGRETRVREPHCASFDAATTQAFEAILPTLDGRPSVLFGHSMGALLAFEVARRLRDAGAPPLALGLSGRRGASLPEHRDPISHLPLDLFIERVQARYAAVPAAILQDPELRQLLVPVLQADLRLIEGYTYVPGELLDCPIFAYAGASDPHAPESELAAWSRETTARVRVRQFPGGHFYLQAGRDSLLSALREDCDTLPVSGVPVPVKVLER